MMKKAVELLRENGNKKTLIMFDTDGDGIGAASVIFKTLKKVFSKNAEAVPVNHGLYVANEDALKEIKRRKIDFIITVDIPVDEYPKYILTLAKKSKILIIDHHQIHKNLNKYKNILHVNPNLWETEIPSYKYCSSKIVYDICSGLTDIEDLDWLAGIGIVNDMCDDIWKIFLNKIYKKYNLSLSKLRLINDIVNSSYYYSGKMSAKIGYRACLEASSPFDILKARTPSSKKLKKMYNKIEKEIASSIKNWKGNAEIFENKKLIILRLKTRFPISSPISTTISLEKPNYTVVVAREEGKMTYMSLRRQDKRIDCGKIASSITKNLKSSSGGGHIPAAGAHILSKDWGILRKRILDLF
jgi:single-stranded DNA-specific DHH superfamily exonuclease